MKTVSPKKVTFFALDNCIYAETILEQIYYHYIAFGDIALYFFIYFDLVIDIPLKNNGDIVWQGQDSVITGTYFQESVDSRWKN